MLGVHLMGSEARALALFNGDALELNSLGVLTEGSAEALRQLKGLRVELGGLTDFNAAQARAFYDFAGQLSLRGVREVSPDVARIMARYLTPAILSTG